MQPRTNFSLIVWVTALGCFMHAASAMALGALGQPACVAACQLSCTSSCLGGGPVCELCLSQCPVVCTPACFSNETYVMRRIREHERDLLTQASSRRHRHTARHTGQSPAGEQSQQQQYSVSSVKITGSLGTASKGQQDSVRVFMSTLIPGDEVLTLADNLTDHVWTRVVSNTELAGVPFDFVELQTLRRHQLAVTVDHVVGVISQRGNLVGRRALDLHVGDGIMVVNAGTTTAAAPRIILDKIVSLTRTVRPSKYNLVTEAGTVVARVKGSAFALELEGVFTPTLCNSGADSAPLQGMMQSMFSQRPATGGSTQDNALPLALQLQHWRATHGHAKTV